jgi:hypothetical protein
MPTQIIDTSLHVAAIPATYTGPGNLVGNSVNSQGKDVYGNFTSAGNAVQINVGFTPLSVDIMDVTGALMWHWQVGMPAINSVKTTLGTVACVLDATSAITVATDLAGNGTVTLSAAMVGSAKNICYAIQG